MKSIKLPLPQKFVQAIFRYMYMMVIRAITIVRLLIPATVDLSL